MGTRSGGDTSPGTAAPPVRRPARSRRARGSLSTQQVVRAALELLDRDGLEGLSMPRLAAALDCGTMSLYSHVPDKQALLELVLAEALAGLPTPLPAPPPDPTGTVGPRDIDTPGAVDLRWLRDWAVAVHAALIRHRGVSAVLSRCAFPTDVVRDQLASVSRALQGQGLSPTIAEQVLWAVLDLVLGAAARSAVDPVLIASRTGADERFLYALDALVAGLERRTTPGGTV